MLRKRWASVLWLFSAFTALTAGAAFLFWCGRSPDGPSETSVVHVLSYSSFVAAWGPGPEVARRFQEKTGVKIEYRDAEDAGFLLKKLELFPSDVVLGLDQLLVPEARHSRRWRSVPPLGGLYQDGEFVAFDWGPMTFVYRDGEIVPPQSLDDLLDKRFAKQIALQDPRTSTPGLQFLFWVLDSKGIDAGFAFLKELRASIHSVSASWATAYGLFQGKQAQLAFSYLTSPVYHWEHDHDMNYRAVVFSSGHPVQIEYAAIPDSCRECAGASEFVRFLLEPEIQRIIVEKNYMMPVRAGVEKGTLFEKLPAFTPLQLRTLSELLAHRAQLLERWTALAL